MSQILSHFHNCRLNKGLCCIGKAKIPYSRTKVKRSFVISCERTFGQSESVNLSFRYLTRFSHSPRVSNAPATKYVSVQTVPGGATSIFENASLALFIWLSSMIV